MFETFKNIFRSRPKSFLGIDIGSSAIRIVELKRESHGYLLKNYGGLEKEDIGEGDFRSSEKDHFSLSDKDIADAIKAILRETGIKTREVGFSIPDFNSFFTNLKLPTMEEGEVAEAIRYQIRPFIPLPIEDVVLDWSIIEGEPGQTSLKILVVAIPKEIVSQYQRVANLSGLNLKFLESEVFSLARSLPKNLSREKIISLVDIGKRSTTCSIVERGVLKISYSFNTAGNELTESIARSLNVSYNKAESIKKSQGLVVEKDDISQILIPIVDSILEEVKRVFRDFYQKEGKEIDGLVLSGGGATMAGLLKYFRRELKKETIMMNPFLNLISPPILKGVLIELGPFYGEAVGLAMKGLE